LAARSTPGQSESASAALDAYAGGDLRHPLRVQAHRDEQVAQPIGRLRLEKIAREIDGKASLVGVELLHQRGLVQRRDQADQFFDLLGLEHASPHTALDVADLPRLAGRAAETQMKKSISEPLVTTSGR
jgi:hypothetical protein